MMVYGNCNTSGSCWSMNTAADSSVRFAVKMGTAITVVSISAFILGSLILLG